MGYAVGNIMASEETRDRRDVVIWWYNSAKEMEMMREGVADLRRIYIELWLWSLRYHHVIHHSVQYIATYRSVIVVGEYPQIIEHVEKYWLVLSLHIYTHMQLVENKPDVGARKRIAVRKYCGLIYVFIYISNGQRL